MKKKNTEINIALIAARSGSKRIKNKSFLRYKKERIINLALKIGLEIKELDYVILSSDSNKILNLAKNKKKLIKIYRAKSISRDNSPMLPVIKDAVIKTEKITNKKVSKIVILDPTSILRRKKDILDAIKTYDKKKPSLLVSVNKSNFSPYFSMLEKKNKYFDLCKKMKKNVFASQQAKNVYNVNTVVWIYSRNSILFEKIRIPKKTLIFETQEKFSLELNTKEDKNRLLKKKNEKK